MFAWGFQKKKQKITDLEIRNLLITDFDKGFVESLSSLSLISLDKDQFSEILKYRLCEGIETIAGLYQGRIVGTASYFIELKFLHNGGKVMHIEDVAVHKDFQSCGVGKELVNWLNQAAKEAGCYKIILDCNKENIKFYQKCEFKVHGYEMRKNV